MKYTYVLQLTDNGSGSLRLTVPKDLIKIWKLKPHTLMEITFKYPKVPEELLNKKSNGK